MQTHVYRNPDKYSKNNNLQYGFAMRILSQANICPSDRILDLGCGDGRITCELAKLACDGSVIGTDISEKMIEHANSTYAAQGNLRFMAMDTSKNIFKRQFDVITSFNSLHWVKDQKNALRGITEAATQDAKIVLLLSHRKSYYHFTLDTLCSSSTWSTYFQNYSNPRSFFTKDQYAELLSSSGLGVILLKETEMIYEFSSIAELKSFLSASMANIKQIPEHLKEDFLEDFCVEFLNQSGCTNTSRIPLSFWCLEIFAKKVLENKQEQRPPQSLRSKL